jgi:hypothetical protein
VRAAPRLLVFALILATSGIFQSFACASAPVAHDETVEAASCCDDERQQPAEHASCADCGVDCGICIACPVTVAPPATCAAPAAFVTVVEIVSGPAGRAASGLAPDIFQPPKA